MRALALCFALFLQATLLSAQEGAVPLSGAIALPTATTPKTIEELRDIQKQVRGVLEKVSPAVVGLRIGTNSGSGIIVTKDGYVLTAGHVSGQPGRDVAIIFPNGKVVKGITLGAHRGIDSGMVKIVDPGEYPHVPMGTSSALKKGTWCVAMGHPGGYKPGRTPVVRVGRVLGLHDSFVQTDCTLVGGDSGGPLFNLAGEVIGIHSRIDIAITTNIHVPVDSYIDSWDRLASSEVIDPKATKPKEKPIERPYLGIQGDPDSTAPRVTSVAVGSPAEKAGLKVNDLILSVDGKPVKTFEEVIEVVTSKRPGEKVTLEVQRGEQKLKAQATLGRRDA
jgi:serine protease Do